MIDADGATDRLTKSAEPAVKDAVAGDGTEAPVITKPVGAVIWNEPICWVDASFVTVNVNETVPPAGGADGDTATVKHLPADEAQTDVDPAAGAASIAATSMPVAPAARSARALVKTALRMMEPPSASADCRGGDAFGKHALPVWTALARARVVIRPFLRLNARSTSWRVQGSGAKAADRPVKAPSGPGAAEDAA